MIPEGWSYNSLDKYAEIIDCKHRTPPYVEKGVPVVSPGSIKWGEIDLITPEKRVTQEEHQKLMDHCTVDIGDLVLSRNQSIGIASYVVCNKPFVLGQDTVLIKPKNSISSFLFYCLQSADTQRTIYKLSGGSTFSRINLKDIRKLKILGAPLPEQKKIAKIISTWDQTINVTEKLIENSKTQKKAFMQQLLTGEKRLKGFKKKWRIVKFSETLQIETGTSKSKYINDTGGNYIVDMGSISREGKLIASKKTDVSRDYLIAGQLVMPKDDIGGGNIIGRTAYIDKDRKYILGDHVYKLTLIKDDSLFINYLINAYEVNKSFRRKANGTAQLGLNKKDVLKQTVLIPPIEEQQKIASILSSADKEIELLQLKHDFLVQEKKALMQQLLTGKRRVKIN